MAYLIDQKNGDPIALEPLTLIGRRGREALIKLSAPESSKLHSVIEWQNDRWTITDYSRNGTWVDGQRLPLNAPCYLSEGQSICFAGSREQVFEVRDLSPPAWCQDPSWAPTVPHLPLIQSVEDVALEFHVSADEESTQLLLHANDSVIDLKVRSHHYLTLNLARQRADDARLARTPAVQGWVPAEVISQSLGLDLCHFNILVHRARKQFSDHINSMVPDVLFERQGGKIRLATPKVEIHKAGQLEYIYTP